MHRLRKPILITGTLLSLLIAVAFVMSGWWSVTVGIPQGPFASIMSGTLWLSTGVPDEFVNEAHRHPDGFRYWLDSGPWYPGITMVPLLYVLFPVAIPTLLVWRLGPKPVNRGHCPCGYDLTGNTRGVCPECGAEVSRAAGAA